MNSRLCVLILLCIYHHESFLKIGLPGELKYILKRGNTNLLSFPFQIGNVAYTTMVLKYASTNERLKLTNIILALE